MFKKLSYLYFAGLIVVAMSGVIVIRNLPLVPLTTPSVLGNAVKALPSPSPITQTHFDIAANPTVGPPITQTSIITQPPIPTTMQSSVELVDTPNQRTEGDNANFSWIVNGPTQHIQTTSIYYGTTSTPDISGLNTKPQDTRYTDWIKDFVLGDYIIPLRFLAGTRLGTAGTYYFRAYAVIDGKYYWSGERTLTVVPAPKNEIKIINYPTATTSIGGNASFTWDIDGPSETTGYTVIVGGKVSKPGTLDASVNLGMTPYAVLVNTFSNGNYAIPLRFIGNTLMDNPGVYYFRALAFINNKNIWSDEYTFTVQ